jgi:hypothetical protein
MTSNRGSAAERRFVSLDMATFRVIFQLTKELPNLPQRGLAEAGLTSSYADEILQFARALRIEAPEDAVVRLFVDDVQEVQFTCRLLPPGEISDRVGEKTRNAIVSRTFIDRWKSSLGEVARWLDGRELFLRTGYEVGEVAAAIRAFSAERNEAL